VEIETRREVAPPSWPRRPIDDPGFTLTADQRVAADRIVAAVEASKFTAFVLFGVTGSGKTEVYIEAMHRAIAAGRQAIMLVPEIALTTQTAQRLASRFERVAVMHSGLTETRRAAAWRAIAAGCVDVVIGTRSAVFAPCPRPGVIIVDEEGEGSYKNLAAPRYHTRDVAVRRAHLQSIPVVLGSATPSLETWHNLRRPHYELIRLPRRVAGLTPPTLQIVDMRAEHRDRRGIHLLSHPLEKLLAGTLARGEQAVLMLNRRGYANYLFCPRCNTPIVCPNCGVFMVFHSDRDRARCHHCSAELIVPARCAMAGCGGTLVRFGMGTERVEEEVRAKFPTARVARMDRDAMTRAADYADILGRFGAREIDVLVGTQMLAKGLDFPWVSCVGVINADTAMAIDDFRAAERTFQLVVQVAGRGGRSHVRGEAVIQTFDANSPVIRFAMQQDYESFAGEELRMRDEGGYPPIRRMVRIVVADGRLKRARDAATDLARTIREKLAAAGSRGEVADARPCPIPRLRNQFRFEVLLSFTAAGRMIAAMTRLRAEHAFRVKASSVTVDVDPLDMQ
jgi:primosomal protein N' (replication factor Y)